MLGNLDEYFTINGTNHGAAGQPNGTIMNNSRNRPRAKHVELVKSVVEQLLGTSCRTLTLV